MGKRGGKAAAVAAAPDRAATEAQVRKSEVAYILTGGQAITVRKLRLRQLKALPGELAEVFRAARSDGGKLNGAAVAGLALETVTKLCCEATGLTPAQVDELDGDDAFGIVALLLKAHLGDNSSVMDFFQLAEPLAGLYGTVARLAAAQANSSANGG